MEDETLQFCDNYRKLNAVTKPDSFPDTTHEQIHELAEQSNCIFEARC